MARLPRQGTRCLEPVVAVEQERAGQGGRALGEQREDEELVPEDMPAVGLAMQAPRRDTHVTPRRVG
ncbi:MAG: hypothetical protein L0Y66_06890 [Myxococcaceae bacterium]|nr:hypothetical protein [Myxococcaceae bacterium]MCI0669967.1 hypothetical protein [Myxococcaceae bacterium]